jgi:hypothetical protein
MKIMRNTFGLICIFNCIAQVAYGQAIVSQDRSNKSPPQIEDSSEVSEFSKAFLNKKLQTNQFRLDEIPAGADGSREIEIDIVPPLRQAVPESELKKLGFSSVDDYEYHDAICQSNLIVLARAGSSKSRASPNKSTIVTRTKFKIEKTLKGDAQEGIPDEILVFYEGGETQINGLKHAVRFSGRRGYQEGHQYLLWLNADEKLKHVFYSDAPVIEQRKEKLFPSKGSWLFIRAGMPVRDLMQQLKRLQSVKACK